MKQSNNRIKFTREQLDKLLKAGKVTIRNKADLDSKTTTLDTPNGRIIAKHFSRKSPAKDYIAANLLKWCNDQALTLTEEYRFDATRKFRFDWAIEGLRLAVEFEGGLYDPNGSHRRAAMIQKDIEKYNIAAQRGWKVLRFHSKNFEQLIPQLNIALELHEKNR